MNVVICVGDYESGVQVSGPRSLTAHSRSNFESWFGGRLRSEKQFEMAPHELNFITGNKNKLSEVQAILDGVIELKNQSLDLPEIQGTIEEVSKDKCKRAAEIVRDIYGLSQFAGTILRSHLDRRACLDRRHLFMFQRHG